MARSIEWVVELTDEHGDVIDPQFVRTEAQALREVPDALQTEGVAYVDVARVVRHGSDDEGEVDRVYDYRQRFYPDGSVVELRTVGYPGEPVAP